MQSPISADDTLDREEVFDTNPNTSFARRPLFWICYLIGVAAFIMLVHSIMPVPDLGTTLTITNITHAIVSFYLMHWIKGAPIDDPFNPQGKYDKLTFWEQLDRSMQWTPTKKFLLTVPIVLLLMTAYTSYQNIIINSIASAVVILAKLPMFHGVRIFNINQ